MRFRKEEPAVHERHVRRQDDMSRTQQATSGYDRREVPAPHVCSARLLEHMAGVPRDPLAETLKELARMELGLPVDPQG